MDDAIRCRVSNWTVGIIRNKPVVDLDCHRVYQGGGWDREPTRVRVTLATWERIRGVASYDVITIAPDDVLPEE